jgi:subtilase family serine protease
MDVWHQIAPISRRRWLLPALAATALIAGTVAIPGQVLAAGTPRVAIPGSRPAWATSAADTGPVPAGTAIDARVYLAGRDPAGLAAYAQQVSEPDSPEYAHYLTPAQYQRRFGPTAAQVSGVRQWLTSVGMDVTAVTGHYVAVRGTEAAAAAAFGTSLHTYHVAGASQRAPQAQVSVPAAVAPAVLSVTGLSTSSANMTTAAGLIWPAAEASLSVGNGTCSAYWGQNPATTMPPAYGHTLPYALCGYVPPQLRAAYGVAGSGLTGRGVTIAIVDPGASPTIVSDVNTYSKLHGGYPLRPGQLTQYLPSDIAQSCPSSSSQTQSFYVEESLDVEAAHAMAPGAHIAYVGADCPTGATGLPDATDMLDAETRIVDGHLADIVSGSWPLGLESQMAPGMVAAYQQVFEQGAVEGIGFYFSSGDDGDFSQQTPDGQPAVQFPASDPWVTSVGGTSLAIGPDGRYEWETGWGSDLAPLSADGTSWTGLPGAFDGGSGGGPSSLFTQPFYQRGVVPDSLSEPAGATRPMRVIPDIAADADPVTGMLVGHSMPLTPGGTPQYIEGVFGGTSVSAPLIAGIQADAQQARHGVPIGFANPAIYARYGTAAYHDVTDHPLGPGVTIAAVSAVPGPFGLNYSAVTFGQDTSLHATVGYDDVTGVGTPAAGYLDSYRVPPR